MILPLIAQAAAKLPDPTSYSSIGWLVVCGVALVLGANAVDEFIGRRKDKPSPADVANQSAEAYQPKGDYASKRDLAEHRQSVENRLNKIDDDISELRKEAKQDRNDIIKAGEDRAGKLHDRIDDILKAVAKIQGRIEK